MFATVAVDSGEKKRYLTLPQTAITYNPYGATVFVSTLENKDAKRMKRQSARLLAQQVFVTPGPTRGDQVAILKGIEAGATVVTSGQLKLKNGTPLRIDNSVQPPTKRTRRLRNSEGRRMNFTDIFIRRPVLAIVDQPADPGAGHALAGSLPVNQYPQTENAVVTISTAYYGADAQTVAGFITQPLEGAIAQAQGIDYLSSTQHLGSVDHHRDAAAELRCQPRADRNQHPGQFGSEPVAAAGAAAGLDACRSARRSTRCTWGSTATRCRTTTSPTIWCEW